MNFLLSVTVNGERMHLWRQREKLAPTLHPPMAKIVSCKAMLCCVNFSLLLHYKVSVLAVSQVYHKVSPNDSNQRII